MKVDIDGWRVDWRSPEGVNEFRSLAKAIITSDSINGSLIEFTVKMLGVATAPIPEKHRSAAQVSMSILQTAWQSLEDAWQSGEIANYDVELKRVRTKGWRQHSRKKQARDRPRLYARVSFLISGGQSREGAIKQACSDFLVSQTQANAWYDGSASEVAEAIRLGKEIPIHVGDAFIAESRKVHSAVRPGLRELQAAVARISARQSKKNKKHLE